jgi:hypothetical protein
VVVIGEVIREILVGVGEFFVRSINGLRKEKNSFGEGTTAALEIEKRQGRRRNRSKGDAE